MEMQTQTPHGLMVNAAGHEFRASKAACRRSVQFAD
jgi:hypothetical protein